MVSPSADVSTSQQNNQQLNPISIAADVSTRENQPTFRRNSLRPTQLAVEEAKRKHATAFFSSTQSQNCNLQARKCLTLTNWSSMSRPPPPPPPPPPTTNKDQQRQNPSLQEINIKSGEKERLKELLRERLLECGWIDEMKALCRAFTRKKGRNNVTVDDLVHVISPKGRSSIPDSVKAELLQRIRAFLASTAD
ncbi:transcription and mRNA export factor ENY2 isoform X2 [Gossypium hirsutum]|uniref:Transcription and mRNA export factor ENY2 n=1 Tax=Gossypium hirsutum TaxID=3635 RepID=A0A1U8PCA0_GOSHI|nr:transcription and mRNA export factor ENY2 isoform X2 [Gossypium hirsutum]